MDIIVLYLVSPLLIGWILDRVLGDPIWLPHPIVLVGNIISKGEKVLNNGRYTKLKGAIFSISLIIFSFLLIYYIKRELEFVHPVLSIVFSAILIFYCLAGKTLIDEVKQVFVAVDRSTEEGRKQVGRIVGRDTSQLDPQQIRTAALETLSENLSDGVIAPLFWYLVLGVPGMFAYKVINTLDSMIGYKSERHRQFGCWAACIDDVANYIPARLTALLMVIVNGKPNIFPFIKKYASKHASPNSGYPESALAGILNCRFGGSNIYFDKVVNKPYIGDNPKELTSKDMLKATTINSQVEILMISIIIILQVTFYYTI